MRTLKGSHRTNKPWKLPVLIRLTRVNPEERVLMVCKNLLMVGGSDNDNSACYTVPGCGECDLVFTS